MEMVETISREEMKKKCLSYLAYRLKREKKFSDMPNNEVSDMIIGGIMEGTISMSERFCSGGYLSEGKKLQVHRISERIYRRYMQN